MGHHDRPPLMSICSPRRAAVIAAAVERVDRGKHIPWIKPKNATPAQNMSFYLGGHRPYWLSDSPVPMFISATTLGEYKGYDEKWPIALRGGMGNAPWALDSGGFTELKIHGEWRQHPDDYGGAVVRFMDEYGMLPPDFVATQDWMCEPVVIKGGTYKGVTFAGTGLTIRDHIELTVENYLYLAEEFYFVPWLIPMQGYRIDDYLLCEQMLLDAGVDLTGEFHGDGSGRPLIGLGSVCRREATSEVLEIVQTFADKGYRLHGFGVKTDGLKRYGHLLDSADSMAWSYAARMENIRLPDTAWGACTHSGICNNCLRWALTWREIVLAGLHGTDLDPDWSFLAEMLAELDDGTGQLAFDFNLIGA